MNDNPRCTLAPDGWTCTRLADHGGPCAAVPVAPPHVTYFAISLFSSRTTWLAVFTFLSGVLAMPQVLAVIPLRWLPFFMIAIGIVALVLRTLTVRPVALIAPGSSAPVLVPRIDPPTPPLVTD